MPSVNTSDTSDTPRWLRALRRAGWLPIMVAIPAVLVLWMRQALQIPICDDAFITLSAVRHLAEGDGLWFDPRQKVQIVTGPLWALPIATLRTMGMDVIQAAKLLGSLFDVTMVMAVVALGRRLTGVAGIGAIAAVLTVLNPYVTMLGSFRGMETSLSITVICLAFVALARERHASALVLGVLAVMARFDGLIALGTVGLVWLFRRRKQLFTASAIRELLPAAGLTVVYLGSTWWATGDLVPWSVRRKASTAAPEMFSAQWLERAEVIGQKFAEASRGLVPFHTRFDPPSDWTEMGITVATWLTVPLVIGLVAAVVKRNRGIGLFSVYGLLFTMAFISGGRAYATNFPWYFAPAGTVLGLVAAYGAIAPLQWLAQRVLSRRSSGAMELTCLAIAVGLIGVQFDRIHHSATVVNRVASAREGGYATATVWFGKHLEAEGMLVANEIGTVGFWARSDHEVLDPFGLSRRYDERKMPFVKLLKRHKPVGAIIAKQFAYHVRTMDKHAPGAYTWHRWRGLHIGLRADVAPSLLPKVDELDALHADLDLNHEYPWSNQAP